MPVLIGTSGWQYPHWKGRFYPDRLPQARWLEYYAERFDTVEVNNAFYRLPEAEVFERWAQRTPDGFVTAVKASRYLTHVKRLKEPAEPVARLVDRARHLGGKLGPILLQLPPNLRGDPDALAATLACFPRDVRVAVEPRHDTWFTDRTAEVLASHDAALCLADAAGQTWPRWRTASWGYVRFHSGRADPRPCYGRAALDSWAVRLAELWPDDTEVYAYFNNDAEGCAVRDARCFALAVARHGRTPTSVPGPGEVRIGPLRS